MFPAQARTAFAPTEAPRAPTAAVDGLAGLTVTEHNRCSSERAWQEALHKLGYPRPYVHCPPSGAGL